MGGRGGRFVCIPDVEFLAPGAVPCAGKSALDSFLQAGARGKFAV